MENRKKLSSLENIVEFNAEDKVVDEKAKIKEYITRKVKDNILEYNLIEPKDKVLVAVSGGPDSICLLNVLKDLKDELEIELYVAHVNHMIRPESKDEQVYVKRFCKKLSIPFYYKEADIPNISVDLKLSEETASRKVRYDYFNELYEQLKVDVVATAHNQDDDVETIMLNIIRGTGLKGLSGMNFVNGNIIRPLLNIEKKDILEYCKALKLKPKFDSSNLDEKYVRNKVRLNLIPKIKEEYNPNFVQNIVRMKEILKQEEDFIDSYAYEITRKSIIFADNINIEFKFSELISKHPAIQKRCLRQIISYFMGNVDGLESIHIRDILKLLNNNIKGKKYIIGNKFTIEIIKKNVARIY